MEKLFLVFGPSLMWRCPRARRLKAPPHGTQRWRLSQCCGKRVKTGGGKGCRSHRWSCGLFAHVQPITGCLRAGDGVRTSSNLGAMSSLCPGRAVQITPSCCLGWGETSWPFPGLLFPGRAAKQMCQEGIRVSAVK